MPPQELIDRSSRVLEQLLVKVFTSDACVVFCETDNLIIILRTMGEMELHVHTVGYAYVWIDCDIVANEKRVNIRP